MNLTQEYIDTVRRNRERTVVLARLTFFVVTAVMLMLAIALIVNAFGARHTLRLEAGEELPTAEEISGKKNADFDFGEEEIDFSEVGDYTFHIIYGNSKRMKIKVKVRDTEAPKGNINRLYLHNGSSAMPKAEDFFDEISEASDYTASFKNVPTLSGNGDYPITVVLADEHGNKREYETVLSVINDTEAPRILWDSKTVVGYIGEGISYKNAVTVTDNCFGVKLEWDSSGVDMTKEGNYTVSYRATDAAGNKVSAIIPVVIYSMQITDDKLNARIGELASQLGMSKSLSKEELCRLIYGYVNDPTATASTANFTYVGHSNDKSRADWRREAWLTLDNGQGDCYSYFALSKAFFEYFGIENKDIERTKGLTSDTHFWSMVKVDGGWYFFDATRYAGKFTLGGDNGCLLTYAQLKAYKLSAASAQRYGDNYYAFDEASYPTAATKIINDKFTWK